MLSGRALGNFDFLKRPSNQSLFKKSVGIGARLSLLSCPFFPGLRSSNLRVEHPLYSTSRSKGHWRLKLDCSHKGLLSSLLLEGETEAQRDCY